MKRRVLNALKWIGRVLGVLILGVILAGLIFRMVARESQPLGTLVDVGEFKMHINASGPQSERPTVVIEGGLGMATEFYHWLDEGLQDSIRVVRYDRAGIGYSEASVTPRDPETIANELHALLESAGEEPPYIMVGHSLGGPYVRVFTEMYPNEVKAMFLLDTTHPDRVEKIKSIPREDSRKFQMFITLQKALAVLGDLGVLGLWDRIAGPSMGREMEGLPAEINDRTAAFLVNGKYVRTMTEETAYYHTALERAGRKTDFGALPVRIFPSLIRDIPEDIYQKYLKKGMDLRANQQISRVLQEDLLNLSSNSELIELEGGHATIFTKKENSEVICREILEMVREIREE